MSVDRILVIASREWRAQISGPLLWALIVLAAAAVATMNPTAMIPSSGSSPLLINSRLAVAQSFALTSFFLYNFFAAIMAGLCVIRDEERGVGELLHATSLSAPEYVTGKFAGVMGALLVAVAAHVGLVIVFVHAVPGWNPEAVRGPFQLAHFVLPALTFAIPGAAFSAGVAFFVGERSRQPLLVFAVPTVIFLVTVFVFNALPLGRLEPAVARLLMIADPSGLRWLRETAFAFDRGAAFYNAAPLGLDTLFWLGRVVAVGVPLALVTWSARSFRTSAARSGERSRFRRRKLDVPAIEGGKDHNVFAPLASLRMRSSPPGLLRGSLAVARTELRELRAQPAVLVYLLLMLAMVLEFAGSVEVAGSPVMLTAGVVATGTLPVITFLLSLLLLFVGVESLTRERRTGADAIVYASPIRSSSLLLGKGLTTATLAAVVLAACTALGLALLALQPGDPRVEVWPFLLVWGGLMAPSLFVWLAFVTAVTAMVRGRLAAYAVGLLTLVASGYAALTGSATWVTNWTLTGALRWSDLGAFELHRRELLLNRSLMMSLGFLLAAVAVRSFSRRERATERRRRRWAAPVLLKESWWLVRWATVPALLAAVLFVGMNAGPGGEAAAERARRYRSDNLVEWGGAEPPARVHIDLEIDLKPARRRAGVIGTYTLVNQTAKVMKRLALTVSPVCRDVRWRLDGETLVHADRGGLHVLLLPSPLEAGGAINLTFEYRAVVPPGLSRRGGGAEQFILPSGVVLHTLRNSFLPVPGFDHNIGFDPDLNDYKSEPDRRRPAVGPVTPFTTRVRVTAPAEYTVNSVGRLAETETADGRTTVVWKSDVPVRALNLVAGRWVVARRDGAAVFHHFAHDRNVDAMLHALAAARRHYSTWFGSYPWPELRLSEFPDLVTLAQGFPSNITFSEGVGFLADDQRVGGLPFAVAAHEAAHQWWGNLLNPADVEGADVLIEGMANYATLLLHEAELGAASRIGFARLLEERYLAGRRLDSEPPLLATFDSGTPGYETVVFDKAAWALWMLHGQLGQDQMLAALGEFFALYREPAPDGFATLNDLLRVLRERAPDTELFDAFVEQWFERVVLPEFEVRDIAVEIDRDLSTVTAVVENVGSGKVNVEVAVTAGNLSESHHLRLEPGLPKILSWTVPFSPEQIVVDPDGRILQRGRAAYPVP